MQVRLVSRRLMKISSFFFFFFSFSNYLCVNTQCDMSLLNVLHHCLYNDDPLDEMVIIINGIHRPENVVGERHHLFLVSITYTDMSTTRFYRAVASVNEATWRKKNRASAFVSFRWNDGRCGLRTGEIDEKQEKHWKWIRKQILNSENDDQQQRDTSIQTLLDAREQWNEEIRRRNGKGRKEKRRMLNDKCVGGRNENAVWKELQTIDCVRQRRADDLMPRKT